MARVASCFRVDGSDVPATGEQTLNSDKLVFDELLNANTSVEPNLKEPIIDKNTDDCTDCNKSDSSKYEYTITRYEPNEKKTVFKINVENMSASMQACLDLHFARTRNTFKIYPLQSDAKDPGASIMKLLK